ncbi:hypothetical protein JHU04_000862 [Brenneria sp. 4F2]|nr:hypothetical protein [Brenneria bubanii]
MTHEEATNTVNNGGMVRRSVWQMASILLVIDGLFPAEITSLFKNAGIRHEMLK